MLKGKIEPNARPDINTYNHTGCPRAEGSAATATTAARKAATASVGRWKPTNAAPNPHNSATTAHPPVSAIFARIIS
jgi:hypothetical protein